MNCYYFRKYTEGDTPLILLKTWEKALPEEKPEAKATCSILRVEFSSSIWQEWSIRKVLIN